LAAAEGPAGRQPCGQGRRLSFGCGFAALRVVFNEDSCAGGLLGLAKHGGEAQSGGEIIR
jgi:hypothetical protein